MPDSVKILGAIILGATWLILVRDYGHSEKQHVLEWCVSSRIESHGDTYRTANRICKEIYK